MSSAGSAPAGAGGPGAHEASAGGKGKQVYPAGDPVFVLHRFSEARPTPAHFQKWGWARWCTRLTKQGKCTFSGCTFVHSLSEFKEWAARVRVEPSIVRKWREDECERSFSASVAAAEALETGRELPFVVPGLVKFNTATPAIVRRDWAATQPGNSKTTRWLMRVARKPPGLEQPQLVAVLSSKSVLELDVMPEARSKDGSKPAPLGKTKVERLPWEPWAVQGPFQVRARTTAPKLHARIALVFIEGKPGAPKSCRCLSAEVDIKAIPPVKLYGPGVNDASVHFNDGEQSHKELGILNIVDDDWDNPALPDRVPLAPYRMPPVATQHRAAKLHASDTPRKLEAGLFTQLSASNYADRFHSLLCLNHASHLAQLRKFTTRTEVANGHMRGGRWCVEVTTAVPVEGKDLFGVCMGLRTLPAKGAPSDTVVQGHVIRAEDSKLVAEFNAVAQETLKSGTGVVMMLYPPTLRYRFMHRAVEDAKPLYARLFGDTATPDAWGVTRSQDVPVSEGTRLRPVLDQLDEDQQRVVESLLAQSAQAVPTVVMGPFGCGKSTAIVRAVLAALCRPQRQRGAVLVATQTNSAADYLTKAVIDMLGPLSSGDLDPREKVLRLYAPTRRPEQVDRVLLRYSNYDGSGGRGGRFVIPGLEFLREKMVIVTTCVMAGALRSAGLGPATETQDSGSATDVPAVVDSVPNHFSDVIVDEAAQVWEPEALIPLSLAGQRTKITLVGDPQQQQPDVHSWLARQLGLGTSILERMYALPVYSDEMRTATNCRILLRNNYRCHRDIVKFASSFYANGEDIVAQSSLEAPLYPGLSRSHALLFQPVIHTDARDIAGRGGSVTEADACLAVAANLLQGGEVNVSDILVIAPQFYQMSIIRQRARGKHTLRGLTVDTITNVQGREFSVLIISTVSGEHNPLVKPPVVPSRKAGSGSGSGAGDDDDMDEGEVMDEVVERVKPAPSLLFNSRLFNTVVTRAKRLVVAVGGTKTLRSDPNWARFIECAQTLRGASSVARAPAPATRPGSLPARSEPKPKRGRRKGNSAAAASSAPAPAPASPVVAPTGPSALGGTPVAKGSGGHKRVRAIGSPGGPTAQQAPAVSEHMEALPVPAAAAPGISAADDLLAAAALSGLDLGGGMNLSGLDPTAGSYFSFGVPATTPGAGSVGDVSGGRKDPAAVGSTGSPAAVAATGPGSLLQPPVGGSVPPGLGFASALHTPAAHAGMSPYAQQQPSNPTASESEASAAAAAAAKAAQLAAQQQAQQAAQQAGAPGGGFRPPFSGLGVEDMYAIQYQPTGVVRGLYTKAQLTWVLRELWSDPNWAIARVSLVGLVFSPYRALRECVTREGQIEVPFPPHMQRAMFPQTAPLW